MTRSTLRTVAAVVVALLGVTSLLFLVAAIYVAVTIAGMSLSS